MLLLKTHFHTSIHSVLLNHSFYKGSVHTEEYAYKMVYHWI